MSTRDFHLSYCTNCINQEFNFTEGVICSLTKAKGNFESNCLDFKVDSEAVEKKRNKLKSTHPKRLQLDDRFKHKLERGLVQGAFTIKKSRNKYLVSIGYLLLLVLALPVIIIFSSESKEIDNRVWIIPLLYLPFIAVLLWLGRSHLRNEHIISLDFMGILINETRTTWSNYIGFEYLKETKGVGFKRKVMHSINLKFIGREDELIYLDQLSVSRRNLMKTILWFEEKTLPNNG